MITNIEAVQPVHRAEVLEAEARARRAGAEGPLEFAGIGGYGIVLCDEGDRAWKAFRISEGSEADEGHLLFLREAMQAEHEWLVDATRTRIAENVARPGAAHEEEIVLERECVQGFPGGWAESGELARLHHEIERAMLPVGWTAPEFKESSYVYEFETNVPYLVDISMAQRVGMNLVRFVEDVLDGRRRTRDRWHDLAFYILREIPYGNIPKKTSDRLLAELARRDPEIRRSFTLPPGLAGARRR